VFYSTMTDVTNGLRLICCFLAGVNVHAQTLEISPTRLLADQVPSIRATGLQPNEHVTIQAELTDGTDHPWRSHAEFIADSEGIVDVSKDSPVKGSYKNVSRAGLIWSMMPGSSNVALYQPPKQLAPQTIHFKLERSGKSVASADLEQIAMADGVKRIELKGGLHGFLFEPPGEGPFPAVLVLGGSEGGAPVRNAAWLASHGYAAVALAYFKWEGLPQQLDAIPLEYFGEALTWMLNRPRIARDRIGVMGVSRGGELALQLGAMYPQFKAVVGFVPANTLHGSCCSGGGRMGFTTPAWTFKGMPLAYVTMGRSDPAREQAAAIRVEKTQGPILVISGQDDGVWDSSGMCDRVISRLKGAQFKFDFEQLKYPHAGHRAGHPGIYPTWTGNARHPISGREVHYGGTPEGNAESSIDAAPKVLDFLRNHLK
jgi:dienelactone hydrolase